MRMVLAFSMIGALAAWGQAQKDASSDKNKPDRANAYYHFMLAKMYAEMVATSGNAEHMDKADQNFSDAVKADPQLLKAYPKGLPRRSVFPMVYRAKPTDRQR
jgi:hypothetical protein